MPSVLVETGFIDNPDDEDYLNSEAGQKCNSGFDNKGHKKITGTELSMVVVGEQ